MIDIIFIIAFGIAMAVGGAWASINHREHNDKQGQHYERPHIGHHNVGKPKGTL